MIGNPSGNFLHHSVHLRRVDLPKVAEAESPSADLLEKQSLVLLDLGAPARFGEAQVQPRPRRSAPTAAPRAEGVQQPGETREAGALEPGQSSTRDDFESGLAHAP